MHMLIAVLAVSLCFIRDWYPNLDSRLEKPGYNQIDHDNGAGLRICSDCTSQTEREKFMVPKPRNVSFYQFINAPAADVYRAFTNSTLLREWLCDAAQADPHLKGRMYLWWNNGYYMCGEYTQLLPGQTITFTWHGRGDPGDTEVTVHLVEKGSATQVTLKQIKVKSRGGWIRFRDEIQRGWVTGLENLASVLETGQDLRIVRRPILGVNLGDYGAEQTAQLGVPVTEGIRLDDVIPGMGAALLLSTRSLPIVPTTVVALVNAVHTDNEAVYNEIARCFESISEAEASRPPAPGEWSAKEVLAHLIHSERDLHAWIAELVNNQERVADSFGDNVQARVTATVTAYPLINDLLSELKHHQIETMNLLANLPVEFQACKGNYWRMGTAVLQAVSHIRAHICQIQAAIKATQAQG